MTFVYEIAKDYDVYPDMMETNVFHAGTEYEIEDVRDVSQYKGTKLPSLSHEPIEFGGYNWILDGSLRNNGIEVTTPPLTYEESLKAFEHIHQIIETGPDAYSSRTSIHVHVNVLPWSTQKLYDFVLLYALLEPAFFSMAPNRKHNINCVPLNYTVLPAKYSAGIDYLLSIWSKYTSFNIMPVKSYGTVEFRHMYGTGDIQTYKKWLTMLRNLWEKTNESPIGFVKDWIMQGSTPASIAAVTLGPEFSNLDYSESLIDVKLSFV